VPVNCTPRGYYAASSGHYALRNIPEECSCVLQNGFRDRQSSLVTAVNNNQGGYKLNKRKKGKGIKRYGIQRRLQKRDNETA
jgi:hypothetical protein